MAQIDRQTPRIASSDERGIAMITTLLVLMLMSALLVGFTTVVISDQRYRFIDRDRGQAFYAASGGLEKLTTDLGNLFFTNVAPNATAITNLTTSVPSLNNVTYTAATAPSALPASQLSAYYCNGARHLSTVGGSGYTVTFCADNVTNNPVPTSTNPIKTGPYEGLVAAQTPYQLDVTARTSSGGEVHLIRTMEAVAIPVFQFGIFSDVDLSFFAGPNFDFGGRVHTNGNLFLSQGDGATLTLRDKVTAVREVVRQQMQNGVSIDQAHAGNVSVAKAPNVFRNLLRTEGSVVDGSTSGQNEPLWHTTSLSTYNSWIRNGRTGAKTLNLPLVTVGGTNPDLIRRAPAGEDTANAVLFGERMFSKASIRILLSDQAADITQLPTVTGAAPVPLDGDWNTTPPNNGTAYGPVDATHPPVARTPGANAITVRGNHAAGWTTLNVSTPLPGYYTVPTLTVTKGANSYAVTCTGKTATTFTGCTSVPVNPAVASPAIVAVAAGAVNATTPFTTTTANWAAGGATLTVGGTAAFSPAWFFVATAAGAAASQMLVQCVGYDNSVAATPSFTACASRNGAATPALTAGWAITTNALAQGGAPNVQVGTLGGFIKIERQSAANVWNDVTMEILNYGIGAANQDGTICADPTPNAIVRLERLRDNGGVNGANGGGCTYGQSANASDWWPNTLFDVREALQRDAAPAAAPNVVLGGVMHYVAIDVTNLAKWFLAQAPYDTGTGANSVRDNGGWTVYFSDRRNNRDASSLETGEYGWEDFVNPASATGAANATLDPGEDVNGNGVLDLYGGVSNYNAVYNAAPPGASAPLNAFADPTTTLRPGEAMVNRAILFRRALKLVNGGSLNTVALPITGLSVVAENPIYIQGNWNAAGGNFNGAHAATSVMGDSVTLLSNSFTDYRSFTQPYTPANRPRNTQTWYRVAIVSGKGAAFPQPNGTAADFGTDGGAHNFLRYLENGDQAVNYRGAIATFFYNRQGNGVFKCCTTVYGAPTRNYAFDIDFLTPALLPPNTPVFRDMNAVGFSQELRPGR